MHIFCLSVLYRALEMLDQQVREIKEICSCQDQTHYPTYEVNFYMMFLFLTYLWPKAQRPNLKKNLKTDSFLSLVGTNFQFETRLCMTASKGLKYQLELDSFSQLLIQL